MKKKESEPVKLPLSQYTETTYSIVFENLVKDYSDAMYRALGNKIRESAFTFDDDKDLGKQAFMILRSFLHVFEKGKFGDL